MRDRQSDHNYVGPVMDEDLSSWLGRPQLVSSGVLDVPLGRVFNINYNSSLPLSIPIWGRKLANVLGIRADLHVTLNINASPFHAGIFRLAFVPAEISSITLATVYNRTAARQTIVTCPGQTFTLQDTTQVCFTIPYINSQPFLSLRSSGTGWDALGVIQLWSLTGMTLPAGTPSPTYSCYLHWSNITLVGPKPNAWSATQPQGLFEDLQKTRAISTTLAAGSTVLSTIGQFPLVPKAVSNAGWLLRMSANFASRLGFSKPMVNEATTRVQPANGYFRGQATGADYAGNLSIFSDSAVPVKAACGTDLDESSVAYIASVPGLINSFNLSSTQTSGTLVYAAALTPASLFYQPGNINLPLKEYITAIRDAKKAFYMSPAMGAASCAKFWRGDFKFVFRFSKTRYHMGRLAFVFVPGSHDDLFTTVKGLTGYQFPTYAEIGSLPRTLVDLRNVSEAVIDCPFVATSAMSGQQSHIGYLCVYVVDPINAPATVTPSVPVLVEAAMNKLALSTFVPPAMLPTPRNAANEVYAQSGFGGAVQNVDTGEVIESLNLITRRTIFTTLPAGVVTPFLSRAPQYTGTSPDFTAVSGFAVTLTNYVRAAFAYERGGMIVETRSALTPLSAVSQATQEPFFPTEFESLPGNPSWCNYLTVDSHNTPVARTYVPRYTPNAIYKAEPGSVVAAMTREPGRIPMPVTCVNIDATGTPIPNQYLGIATADDHQFMFFIGWPAVVWPTTHADLGG